jgi:hypothetical protein
MAVMSHVGYLYLATYEGDAFEAPLSHFTDPLSTPVVPYDVTLNPPKWLKRLVRAKTSARFDGIATLPAALMASSSSEHTVKPWNEQ